jgi:hypothetical protein
MATACHSTSRVAGRTGAPRRMSRAINLVNRRIVALDTR